MSGPWDNYAGSAAQPAAQPAAPDNATAAPWAKYGQNGVDFQFPKDPTETAGDVVNANGQTGAILDFARQHNPLLSKMTDGQLASLIRTQHYPQMDPTQFYRAINRPDLVGDVGTAPFSPLEGSTEVGNYRAGLGGVPNQLARGIGQFLGVIPQKDVDQADKIDAPLMRTDAGIMGNLSGQMFAALIPSTAATKVGEAMNLGLKGRMVAQGLAGAAYAGSQPVPTGGSRAENAAVGGLAGAVGEGVSSGASKIAAGFRPQINPNTASLADRAAQFGIPLHASQLVDSRSAKTAASALNALPLSGGTKAAAAQQAAFNSAVGSTFDAPAPILNDSVMKAAGRNLSNGYRAIFGRNTVTLDQQAMQELAQLHTDVGNNMEAAQADVARKQIARIIKNAPQQMTATGQMNVNGTMTGDVYQNLRGALKNDFSGNEKLDRAVMQARSILDDAAARSMSPQDAQTLQALNSKWANYKTTQDALKQVAGARGDVRPASLWPLIRNGSTSDMRDLAKIGQVLLKDPIPDSGTAARAAVYTALGVGGANPATAPIVAKAAALGATLGRIGNSNALAGYMLNGLGSKANKLASLGQSLPYIAPAYIENAREKDAADKTKR